MKNKVIMAGLAIFASGLAPVSTLNAQVDSTKVISDTVKVREVEKVYVHDTPTPKQNEAPPLRAGEFGIRFMPTVTSLSFNGSNGEVIQGSATLNYGYGLLLGVNFSKNIGLVGEVDYLGISQKYKDQQLEREIHLDYLNIPVMLSINTNKTKPVNLNLVAGPQFGINVGSSVNTNTNGGTDNVNAVLAVKQGDIGIAYGAGLEFALNKKHTFRFDIGFRGMYGLVDISSDNINENTYNILVHASRKSYGGYAGFTIVW